LNFVLAALLIGDASTVLIHWASGTCRRQDVNKTAAAAAAAKAVAAAVVSGPESHECKHAIVPTPHLLLCTATRSPWGRSSQGAMSFSRLLHLSAPVLTSLRATLGLDDVTNTVVAGRLPPPVVGAGVPGLQCALSTQQGAVRGSRGHGQAQAQEGDDSKGTHLV
jgi:hypothetical protein